MVFSFNKAFKEEKKKRYNKCKACKYLAWDVDNHHWGCVCKADSCVNDILKKQEDDMLEIEQIACGNKIKVMLDKGAYMPKKAHDTDAGFDIRTPKEFEIEGVKIFRGTLSVGMAIIDTGVHIQIPEGYVGMIKTKSGLNAKCNLQTEGVIDAGYTGSIKVKMYNLGTAPQWFEEGDKITQIVIMPIHECNELEPVDSLEETERGDNGFGSTGA